MRTAREVVHELMQGWAEVCDDKPGWHHGMCNHLTEALTADRDAVLEEAACDVESDPMLANSALIARRIRSLKSTEQRKEGER